MGLDSPALDLPHSPRVRRATLRGGVGRALPAAQAERHTTLWLALSFGKGEFGIASQKPRRVVARIQEDGMKRHPVLNPLSPHALRAACAGVVALIGSIAGARQAAADSEARLAIETVSNRADLVSGGDVLVRVISPPGNARNARVAMFVNGERFRGELHAAPDGHGSLALVTGLNLGHNTLTLAAGGQEAGEGGDADEGVELDVTNHPVGGPIFSGPHLQPWVCTTNDVGLGPPVDADCNAPTQYAFYYKSASTGQFVSYDRANPPAPSVIASTTTDQGRTVKYIVRVEMGTLNRSIYRIAVLFDPARSWAPWAPQAGW